MTEKVNVIPDVIKLFSYTEDEQQTFPYLGTYNRKIIPMLPNVIANVDMTERFMLAGLFLTYRAFNHVGLSITTTIDSLDLEHLTIHTERLQVYKSTTGKEIQNTRAYLNLLHLNPIKVIMMISFQTGLMLYQFVIHGQSPR